MIKNIYNWNYYSNKIQYFYQFDQENHANFFEIQNKTEDFYKINETVKLYTEEM